MKSTRIATLHTYGAYQPDRRIDFNGFLWTRPEGGVLVDPMDLDEAGLARLAALGGAAWILVTNADHWRAAGTLADRLGAAILAPAPERERFGEHARRVQHWFSAVTDLPPALRGHLALAWIEGGKSPREPVLDLLAEDALLFSDVVRSHVSGQLTLLPDAKLADRALAVRSVKQLAGRRPGAVLLCDGDSLWTGAAEEFERFVEALR